MRSSHLRGNVKVSEPLGNYCWWQSNSCSVWGNKKFAFPVNKHTLMPPFSYVRTSLSPISINAYSSEDSHVLQYSGNGLATWDYMHHTQHGC